MGRKKAAHSVSCGKKDRSETILRRRDPASDRQKGNAYRNSDVPVIKKDERPCKGMRKKRCGCLRQRFKKEKQIKNGNGENYENVSNNFGSSNDFSD
jgi:hypothetical protein